MSRSLRHQITWLADIAQIGLMSTRLANADPQSSAIGLTLKHADLRSVAHHQDC